MSGQCPFLVVAVCVCVRGRGAHPFTVSSVSVPWSVHPDVLLSCHPSTSPHERVSVGAQTQRLKHLKPSFVSASSVLFFTPSIGLSSLSFWTKAWPVLIATMGFDGQLNARRPSIDWCSVDSFAGCNNMHFAKRHQTYTYTKKFWPTPATSLYKSPC